MKVKLMDLQVINRLNDEVKVGFVITIAEKVFSVIDKDDELIDNPECTGISEFAEY